MNFQQIFTVERIFDSTPSHNNPFMIPEVIFFAVLILLGAAIAAFVRGDIRKFAGKYVAPFLTCGILGFFYVAARYESLPWLASRFFLILIAAALFIWLVVVVVWMLRTIPGYQRIIEKEQRYKKYLPRAKG